VQHYAEAKINELIPYSKSYTFIYSTDIINHNPA